MYNDISKLLQTIGSTAAALGAGQITASAMSAHIRAGAAAEASEIIDYGAMAKAIIVKQNKPAHRMHVAGDVHA